MPKHILYTRPDGGVSICTPSRTALAYMTGGGGRWDGCPRGFLERQISENAKQCGEDAAARFVRAMQFGGLVTYEAFAIIRDRDCARGLAHDIVNVDEIPRDRWFRDAWRRSSNGGPIVIDDTLAKEVQWLRLVAAKDAEDKRRQLDLFAEELTLDLGQYRSRIKAAKGWEDVRRIWPEGLPYV